MISQAAFWCVFPHRENVKPTTCTQTSSSSRPVSCLWQGPLDECLKKDYEKQYKNKMTLPLVYPPSFWLSEVLGLPELEVASGVLIAPDGPICHVFIVLASTVSCGNEFHSIIIHHIEKYFLPFAANLASSDFADCSLVLVLHKIINPYLLFLYCLWFACHFLTQLNSKNSVF